MLSENYQYSNCNTIDRNLDSVGEFVIIAFK